MEKRTDIDSNASLYHRIWTSAVPSANFVIEEFGVTASEVLSVDMLIKQIVDDTLIQGNNAATQTNRAVYLCYNWKLQIPFVVVERIKTNKERKYTPQYGRDNNYYNSTSSHTTYELFAMNELSVRHPEVLQVIDKVK